MKYVYYILGRQADGLCKYSTCIIVVVPDLVLKAVLNLFASWVGHCLASIFSNKFPVSLWEKKLTVEGSRRFLLYNHSMTGDRYLLLDTSIPIFGIAGVISHGLYRLLNLDAWWSTPSYLLARDSRVEHTVYKIISRFTWLGPTAIDKCITWHVLAQLYINVL